MPYDLALVDANRDFEIIEIIDRVESIEWGDNISRAHTYLNFTTGNNQDNFDNLFTTVYNCGDWVGLFDRDTGALILYAVIIKVSRESQYSYSYQCYDLGFYLWKNKVTRDFDGETLRNAIINICDDIQLIAGNIPNINFNIIQIYRNRTAFEIFQDIYRQAVRSGIRNDFHFDCKNGRVNLFRYQENNDLQGFIAQGLQADSLNMITAFKISEDMSDLRNVVQIYSDDKVGRPNMLAERLDDISIANNGYLREIEEVKLDANQNYDDYARTRLRTLNRTKEEFSLTVIGDFNLQKGIFTRIDNDELNLNGFYRVIGTTHFINGTVERVKMDLEIQDLP